MAKTCLKEECNNPRFGGGYCLYHQYLRGDKKKGTGKGTIRPKKPIRKVSKKRARQNAQYLKERAEFLDGKICPITGRPATEIHHTNGRENERLTDKKYWLAVTREGHEKIHANPVWAREMGYLI